MGCRSSSKKTCLGSKHGSRCFRRYGFKGWCWVLFLTQEECQQIVCSSSSQQQREMGWCELPCISRFSCISCIPCFPCLPRFSCFSCFSRVSSYAVWNGKCLSISKQQRWLWQAISKQQRWLWQAISKHGGLWHTESNNEWSHYDGGSHTGPHYHHHHWSWWHHHHLHYEHLNIYTSSVRLFASRSGLLYVVARKGQLCSNPSDVKQRNGYIIRWVAIACWLVASSS